MPPKLTPEPRATRPDRPHILRLFGRPATLLVALALVGVTIPFFCRIGQLGSEARALGNAKGIGLALKLYASDHNGSYPRQGAPAANPAAPASSNEAFACLFPAYVRAETIFGNKLSAYQTREPDNVIDDPYTGRPVRTLEPGENVYGYVAGLTDGDDPGLPLLVDGTDGTGHYVTDAARRGGTWAGRCAVVIHLDNSGTVERLVGPPAARYLPREPGDPTHNLLDAAALGSRNARLLDPAVAARP